MWLVWFDCSKRSGICSSAPSSFPANYLNTHKHMHTWTHRSALCLPYHTVLPTVSAHTLLQLLSVLQIDHSTHTLSHDFCVLLSSSVCLLLCHINHLAYPTFSSFLGLFNSPNLSLLSLSYAMSGFPQHTSVPSALVVPAQNNIHCFYSTVTR